MNKIKIEIPIELACIISSIMEESLCDTMDPIAAEFIVHEFGPEALDQGFKLYEKIIAQLKEAGQRKKLASGSCAFSKVGNA